jgi:hypothetical protein
MDVSIELSMQMERVSEEILQFGDIEKYFGQSGIADGFKQYGTMMKNRETMKNRTVSVDYDLSRGEEKEALISSLVSKGFDGSRR